MGEEGQWRVEKPIYRRETRNVTIENWKEDFGEKGKRAFAFVTIYTKAAAYLDW